MQKLTWTEWHAAVSDALGVVNLSGRDLATLKRWYEDGLTVRAANTNMRAIWNTGTGNHPIVDYTLGCIRGK